MRLFLYSSESSLDIHFLLIMIVYIEYLNRVAGMEEKHRPIFFINTKTKEPLMFWFHQLCVQAQVARICLE